MAFSKAAHGEGRLALHYTLVAVIGFVTDASVLTLFEHLGMQPAWARVFSLLSAMQVTFWINGLWVFRCLTRKSWGAAWLGYMATSGFGNFCNFWVFVTLVSLHNPLWSNRWLDLAIGGIVAWSINYTCARLLVFGARADGCTPVGRLIAAVSARLKTLVGLKPVPAGAIDPVRR